MAADQQKAQTPSDLPAFFTIAQAARALAISRSHLYQLMDSGAISYAKFGRSRRIARAEIEAYIRRCTVPAR
jgi:excisionase family DNA binding protein